jgi:hypothetical protein
MGKKDNLEKWKTKYHINLLRDGFIMITIGNLIMTVLVLISPDYLWIALGFSSVSWFIGVFAILLLLREIYNHRRVVYCSKKLSGREDIWKHK